MLWVQVLLPAPKDNAMPIEKIEFETSIFLCGAVREFLMKCKFDGHKIEWVEERGWLSRRWLVKGDVEDIKLIKSSIIKWNQSIND